MSESATEVLALTPFPCLTISNYNIFGSTLRCRINGGIVINGGEGAEIFKVTNIWGYKRFLGEHTDITSTLQNLRPNQVISQENQIFRSYFL